MKRILSAILIIFLLSGCNNSNNKDATNQNNIPKDSQEVNDKEELNSSINKQEILDFGEKFVPNDFLIKDFIINIEDNKLVYNLKIIMSEELYKFLSENKVEYYFSLEYPERIREVVEKTSTDLIKHVPTNNQLSYNIIFKEELPKKELPDSITDKQKYNLLVINKEGSVVSILDGIEALSNMTKDSKAIKVN
ncbi:membrane lipoprotein lipid attachment site-containing protein [Senegalia massiliensis]|uniref:membrane lipoprotein lipid attachment site-containing protein n=1 Tax=Senegalia massiliensis TaxID=1720316 RepID=UPI001030F284|nr:membrane lipoprotein lipid attachment site-containing protein [Senegalia massiliensis]